MKLICSITTLYILLKCVNSQFDYGEYYKQQVSGVGYQNVPQTNFMNNPELLPMLSNDYHYDTEACDCSCDKCYTTPKTCCTQFCSKCTQTDRQPGYVYVPYPYIVVNTPKVTSTKPTEATTTVATTTVAETKPPKTTTTESEAECETYPLDPEDMLRGNYMKELSKGTNFVNKNRNNKVRLTSLRRTKPRWMPKFGIVPIPDQLAEKLMLRIRQMKVLHPEKDTVRRIESIYPNDSNMNI